MNFLFDLFNISRTEYIYYYSLPFTESTELDEKKRERFMEFVKKDLKNKTIDYSDFITDFKNKKTHYVFGSEKLNNFFIPILYEIAAYKTLNNNNKKIFTYKYKTLILENVTILKFKIKCYGKKK